MKRAIDFGALFVKAKFNALGMDKISTSEGVGENSLREIAMRGMEAVQGTESECSGQREEARTVGHHRSQDVQRFLVVGAGGGKSGGLVMSLWRDDQED